MKKASRIAKALRTYFGDESVPDAITDHISGFFSFCDYDLSSITVKLSSKRQVIDFPVMSLVCTEYRSITKSTAVAQKTNLLTSIMSMRTVQYGSGLETLVGYLHHRQYLLYNRLKVLLKDCYRIDLSEGSIDKIIGRVALKAAQVYHLLKNSVSASAVIGCPSRRSCGV